MGVYCIVCCMNPLSFERLSPAGVVGLPTEVIRGLVDAGVRELMHRGVELPESLRQPDASQQNGGPSTLAPSFISLADGRLRVYPNYGGIEIDGRKEHLKPKIYSALFCLATNSDELVTPDELIHACWPQSPPKTRNCLSQVIRRMRIALGTDDMGHTTNGAIRTMHQRGWVALTSLQDDPWNWL